MNTTTNSLRIVRPTWADGPLQLALCDVRTSTLTLGIGSVERILDNNPARWGFVLMPDSLPAANPRLSPQPDANLFGWVIDFALPPSPITIMEWGPLVPREWYLYSGAPLTIRVVEWFARH
jgi:hypothetical protein